MYLSDKEIERPIALAEYMLENNSTVRSAASVFGVSKSTVHKDVSKILRSENYALYLQVKELLEKNKSERHFRGGEATRRKYIEMKKARNQ